MLRKINRKFLSNKTTLDRTYYLQNFLIKNDRLQKEIKVITLKKKRSRTMFEKRITSFLSRYEERHNFTDNRSYNVKIIHSCFSQDIWK